MMSAGRRLPSILYLPCLHALLYSSAVIYSIAFFGGRLRGALALALALGFSPEFPEREAIGTVGSAVVTYSTFVHGLTIVPLLQKLEEVP